ncbi:MULTISPECIES: tol-pal system YbgF family protein [unclassified Nitratiruptor]|uniref:tetratricopeptide repeat protein n=1 Tax=unclassified Nitratiruptor TaxID=2624044 RepID=UPI001916AB90|nr:MULTISPECIES: tetratricopeptide repeat protein [unclassified Nitratiruptor]BCD59920.1 hypothetical protein NitYY0810_C0679 [Nitratiruptor sp. YY08-10]BCD63843.1 hypothetical protein NitYY0814_C0678 [Nitratiruptor sp. YY08-14]
MLRYSLFLFCFLTAVFASTNETIRQHSGQDFNETNTSSHKDNSYIKIVYENALRDFRVGSYYDALNEFSYVVKFPNTPYFLDALYQLAKTYLAIGKRTGEKKFFWSALNYLNLYLGRGGVDNAKYYYLKALILENLGFYERALALYQLGLAKADNQIKEDILIGMLRTAALEKKTNLFTKYMIMLSIENLSKEQKKEYRFIQGLFYFYQDEYEKARRLLLQTYKEYEEYLIDNPQFYYIVAENAYRYGEYKTAKQLFKRILKYVKNRDVLQKTLLRLGDIAFNTNNTHESVGYYYRLIKKFPKSKYATIAKLKLLYIMKKDKKVQHYLKKFLPDAMFLKNPQKFTLEILVKNRQNYLGFFALANFGLNVLELRSEKLMKRLGWEISLVPVKSLKYEHKEYFRKLWEPELYHLNDPKLMCILYRSNPQFFVEIFTKSVLLHMGKVIYQCEKGKKTYIDLLKRMYKKFKDDALLYKLVDVHYELGQYSEAMKYLMKVKKRGCTYAIDYNKLCFLIQRQCSNRFEMLKNRCKQNSFYKLLFLSASKLEQGIIDTSFVKSHRDFFVKNYTKDPVVRKYVEILAKKMIEKELYQQIIDLLSPIASYIKEDCFLNSILSLSYVRIGKMQYAGKILNEMSSCDNEWYHIAKAAYDDILFSKEIEGQ